MPNSARPVGVEVKDFLCGSLSLHQAKKDRFRILAAGQFCDCCPPRDSHPGRKDFHFRRIGNQVYGCRIFFDVFKSEIACACAFCQPTAGRESERLNNSLREAIDLARILCGQFVMKLCRHVGSFTIQNRRGHGHLASLDQFLHVAQQAEHLAQGDFRYAVKYD